MTVRIPKESELRSRILEHLQARPGNPLVPTIWQGYIGGLLEWGLIDVATHSRLTDLLPGDGRIEKIEVMLGPEHVDDNPEIREEIRARFSTTE